MRRSLAPCGQLPPRRFKRLSPLVRDRIEGSRTSPRPAGRIAGSATLLARICNPLSIEAPSFTRFRAIPRCAKMPVPGNPVRGLTIRFLAAIACAVMLICVGTVQSHADMRVALLIGNGDYQHVVLIWIERSIGRLTDEVALLVQLSYRRKPASTASLTQCPKCGEEIVRVEKFTMSDRDMRTYRCDYCKEEHIVDYGIALWKAMSDSQSEK